MFNTISALQPLARLGPASSADNSSNGGYQPRGVIGRRGDNCVEASIVACPAGGGRQPHPHASGARHLPVAVRGGPNATIDRPESRGWAVSRISAKSTVVSKSEFNTAGSRVEFVRVFKVSKPTKAWTCNRAVTATGQNPTKQQLPRAGERRQASEKPSLFNPEFWSGR